MDQQLELVKSIRYELNGNYLYFTDTCNKIFDLLIDSYSQSEELLQTMEDGIALERALLGTRLEFMLSTSTPLQWAYVASVFKELARNSRSRCGEPGQVVSLLMHAATTSQSAVVHYPMSRVR